MGTPISRECQIASFLHYISISDEARYRKTANAFGISRGSVSLIIRKVSKAIVEFLGKDYMKLPDTVAKVENLTNIFLEHHGFPSVRAIDNVNLIKTMLTIDRRGFTYINVQALCDYRYGFLDVVMKWPESVHDWTIFFQSNLNQKLQNKFPSWEK